jgi:hypothetical protein
MMRTLRGLVATAVLAALTLSAACGGNDEAATAGPPGEEMPVASPDAPMDTTPAGTPAPPMGVAEAAEAETRQP